MKNGRTHKNIILRGDNMYSPCFECFHRYGRQYSEECDNNCDYAMAVKIMSHMQTETKSLQDKIDELEAELEYHHDW